jgi:hypothetical protein
MRSIVNGITAACIVLLSSASSAEPPAVEESQIWVPSLAVTSGILVERARGGVESSVRPSANGTQSLISPWLGGSLEMMGPAWEPLGGRTRFFVHGGLAGNVGFERDLAKEGSPDTFVAPTIPRFGDEALVQGQGSVTRAEPTDFQASAGIGFSITIDTEWRRIRVKPSFEYLVEEIEISGLVHRATSNDPAIPSFNFFAISGTEEKYFHGIGPGLEVEADIVRKGPLLLALTVSGGAYYILGDRDVVISSTDATGAESATWRYRKDAWTYRGHVGLRFRWAPDVDPSP